ncbi:MAG: alpha/beta hydrolase [Paracoccaceae bacterium]|uniref:Alpha/beta hydrolase n=1 Tax=Pseudothioclava arenosa TaxID=1795308 RepID=A0A2A4CM90_9RHOB|nr:alpha/beta hydrolase [Pseudothioclava arenosa]PCD75607.1 alpha/beta hydrolase [Pseudothioclava arenosa]
MSDYQYFIASDGAKLAYLDEGEGVPVLALCGLTRTVQDFDYVAPFLKDVRLIRMDYRGRGKSEWTGGASYTVPQEAADAIALLDHLGIDKAMVLGTSRGGLIAMWLAATAKDRLMGVCLNDVGPKLERAGLEVIFQYIGRNPVAKTYAELAAKLPSIMKGFENVPESRWLEEVHHHYNETPEGLVINYDPALRDGFLAAFQGDDLPEAWPLFEALAGLPLALIWGMNSNLLSREGVEKMREIRPDMIVGEVPGRAHIPYLDEPEALEAIRAWLAKAG